MPTPERPADLRQRGHVGGELPAVPVPGECRQAPELRHRLTLERFKRKKKKLQSFLSARYTQPSPWQHSCFVGKVKEKFLWKNWGDSGVESQQVISYF